MRSVLNTSVFHTKEAQRKFKDYEKTHRAKEEEHIEAMHSAEERHQEELRESQSAFFERLRQLSTEHKTEMAHLMEEHRRDVEEHRRDREAWQTELIHCQRARLELTQQRDNLKEMWEKQSARMTELEDNEIGFRSTLGTLGRCLAVVMHFVEATDKELTPEKRIELIAKELDRIANPPPDDTKDSTSTST